ncbi:hypothetical protein TcasGA2_TC013354 [Tribolium castaneum]|uniref:Uncharacterized protein n=1 Tax=Tribolium castaneum TaxID=7070 RepID=D6WM22_TRICA|nr:hypothetical protein TcasGA2_TC013354 [Tribolium castaneum]
MQGLSSRRFSESSLLAGPESGDTIAPIRPCEARGHPRCSGVVLAMKSSKRNRTIKPPEIRDGFLELKSAQVQSAPVFGQVFGRLYRRDINPDENVKSALIAEGGTTEIRGMAAIYHANWPKNGPTLKAFYDAL